MGDGRFVDINGTGSYVQIAIPLDDVTAENGPLGLVRGSNILGHVEHAHNELGQAIFPPDLVDQSQVVFPTPQAGDVLIFGPYTVHGSGENESEQWRRVFINGFATEGRTEVFRVSQ